MDDRRLEEILALRDEMEFGSSEWERFNRKKAEYLESIKPSTRERIIYFEESDLRGIKEVFARDADIRDLPFAVEKRSLLEYHPTRRHPITYVLIRYEDRYFFILRESGGGELRLIGRKGLVGGHIDEDDIVPGDLERTFHGALLREAREEAGIYENIVGKVELRGLIKSDAGVDNDHLGLVYEMEILTDLIKSEEEGVLTGVWIKKEDLPEHYDSFENWAKIVYDNLLT